jgi:YD repeat-containing protein
VAAPLIPPSQPPAASQQIVAKQLPPGQTTAFTYTGAEMPITQALSSIAGSYDAVFYTQPREHGGTVFEWYPGQSDPSIILEPGSQVAVHVKPGAPATLSFATAPEILPH